jgi:hypothetical protein
MDATESRANRQIGGQAIALWLLLTGTVLFVPAYTVGFLDGVPANHPLDFLFAILVAGFVWPRDFAARGWRRYLRIVLLISICAGLRWASSRTCGTHGLRADYLSEVRPGQFVRQWSTAGHPVNSSRLDARLDFDGVAIGPGRRPLWTDFLNTVSEGDPQVAARLGRGLTVTWNGYITPERDCTLAVEASCPCELKAGQEGAVRAEVCTPLVLAARFSDLHAPRLRLLIREDGRTVPEHWLTPNPARGGSAQRALYLLLLSWTALGLALLLIIRSPVSAVACSPWPAVCLLLGALLSGEVLWEYNQAKNPTLHIMPPDDYLIYESEARTLALNGISHDDGLAFHRSAGMRYYLAAAHWLFGEAGYGVILFQQVLRGGTALLMFLLARRLAAPHWLGWSAAGIVLLLPNLARFSLWFWPETPGTFLFALACSLAVRTEGERGRRLLAWAAGTGLGVGLLALIRTNAVSLVPALGGWMLLRTRSVRPAVVLFLVALCLVSLVALRNLVVTGQAVLWPTEGPVTAVLGNEIPRGTDITWALTGEPVNDAALTRAMEHLWDFKSNPAAAYDVCPPQDQVWMSRALTRVFLVYVWRHPGRYAGQVLARAREWFFPDRNIILVYSLLALLALGSLFRNASSWSTVFFLVACYSGPFLLVYFEGRHRVVILPELILLAVAGIAEAAKRLRAVASSRPPRREAPSALDQAA